MQTTARLWSICGAASFLWLIVPARPSAAKTTVPSARREIQAIYNKIDAALARKDVDTVADFNTDDCAFYGPNGKLLSSDGGRQELVDLLENIDTFQRTAVITSFTGTNAEATVTVKDHTVQATKNNINGRAIKLVTDEVFREYWIKTDDGWKRKRSRETKSKAALHKNF